MLIGLAADHGEEKTVMIDATYLEAHRTASSLGLKSGGSENSPVDCFPDGRDSVADRMQQGRYEHQVARKL